MINKHKTAKLLAVFFMLLICTAFAETYPLPGGIESNICFADGKLYFVTPGPVSSMSSLSLFDKNEAGGFKILYKGKLKECCLPFFINDRLYILPSEERSLKLVDKADYPNAPDDVKLLSEDIFPEKKTKYYTAKPVAFLLNHSKGNIFNFLVDDNAETMRWLCYYNADTGDFKHQAVTAGLFGFSMIDEHNSIYYYSDESSTEEKFFYVRKINWQSGEITDLGALPDGAWGIAYDNKYDCLYYAYSEEGNFYRYTWDGVSSLVLSGLPKEMTDQRGFVLPDRSYAAYIMSSEKPYHLMTVQLPQ